MPQAPLHLDAQWRMGLNTLCPSYKKFFKPIDPAMKIMADSYEAKQPPAAVIKIMAKQRKRTSN
jgi:hypothetical protein